MIPLTLSEIATALDAELLPADAAARTISQVCTDSRELPEGPEDTLFVALAGERFDAHDFLDEVRAAGAPALVSRPDQGPGPPQLVVDDTERAFGALGRLVCERVSPRVIGVTGSVGKTTTKDFIAAAAGSQRTVLAAEGSFNNEVGVPTTLLRLEPRHEVAVIEMGARGIGHIAKLCRLAPPHIGVVTAVANVHLELFGTVEAVVEAKRELVEALPPDGVAVLNADDERVMSMADHTRARVCTVSRVGDADVRARDIRLDRLARPTFVADTPWGSVEVRLQLAGVHYVTNALCALAVAGELGVDLEAAAAALADAATSRWRGEVQEVRGVTIMNDAYNANPLATSAALETLAAIERSGRAVAVLGVMAELGEDHDSGHAQVGHVAADLVDRLVVVGDEATGIADAAREDGLDDVTTVADADAALAALADVAAGDVVLVKASRVAGLEAVADALQTRLSEGANT